MIRIKVCGLTEAGNAADVAACGADYAGFIFYSESKRYVGDTPDPALFNSIPVAVKRVGVFVDADRKTVVEKALRYGLSHAQLHGGEDPETCDAIQAAGICVIKAFGVDEHFDFRIPEAYAGSCDFFLFDTQTPQHGGSGMQFSWNLLQKYALDIPFFLSGGIGPYDVERIISIQHPQLHAVDVNSRFEKFPGVKDVVLVQRFIQELNSQS